MKVCDMHCDTVMALRQQRQDGKKAELLENSGHVDLLRMRQGGYLLETFAVFVDFKAGENPLQTCLEGIDFFYEQMERYRDTIRPVISMEQVSQNEAAGRMSALLSVEEGQVCLYRQKQVRRR